MGFVLRLHLKKTTKIHQLDIALSAALLFVFANDTNNRAADKASLI